MNWFDAMRRPIAEIGKLQKHYGAVPVLCAGDVFHHWKSSPALINFAIDTLPHIYAIPGQHDLPFHAYQNVGESAYGTLVRAGMMTDVMPDKPYIIEKWGFALHGFPWGFKPKADRVPRMLNIALHHAYRGLTSNTMFPGAHPSAKIHPGEYAEFDVVILGDNHISFDVVPSGRRGPGRGAHIFNCGSLMRRNADQKDHQPRVGLVHRSGRVTTHVLESSTLDAFAPTKFPKIDATVDRFYGVIEQMEQLQTDVIDFPAATRDAIRSAVENGSLSPAARQFVLEAVDHATSRIR